MHSIVIIVNNVINKVSKSLELNCSRYQMIIMRHDRDVN